MPNVAPVRLLLLLAVFGVMIAACARKPVAPSSPAIPSPRASTNAFDDYMKTDFEPADGFDFAVGDRDGKGAYQDLASGKRYSGWNVATRFDNNNSYGIH